jgi:DNA polymerase-3 subunit epsilon
MALRSRPKPDAAAGGFAVLDVETIGLSPRTDRIVELAIVRLDPTGAVVAQHASLVNPDRDVGSTRLHGITASDVAGAPRFAELAGWLAARLIGCVLVGHNVAFDLRFAQAEFDRLGIRLPELPALCTMRLAPDYLPSLPRRSLAACCAAAGIPLATAHSALSDAQATARLFAAYRRQHRALPGCG